MDNLPNFRNHEHIPLVNREGDSHLTNVCIMVSLLLNVPYVLSCFNDVGKIKSRSQLQ